MSSFECKKDYPVSIVSFDSYYKHDLQFYTVNICKSEMNYEDLRKLGVTRLTILYIVEKISSRNEIKTPKEWLEELIVELRAEKIEWFADLLKPDDNSNIDVDDNHLRSRLLDHVSHNAVSMSLAQTSLTSKWLQETEYLLFRWRLAGFDEKAISSFMRIQNIQYPVAQPDERMRLKDDLCAASMVDPEIFDDTVFYKVPWVEAATEIVSKHCAVMISGTAYITAAQLQPVLAYRFRYHLKSQLTYFQRNYGRSPDPRVYELVEYFKKVQASMIESAQGIWTPGKTSVSDLDVHAVVSFPPCMRLLHEALNKKNHLRNDGRVQYTLFLKAIGIESKEAIEFYRKIFTKKISNTEFYKNYAYYFRHMYGLVGAKKNYTINDCKKIAQQPIGKYSDHGCPFTRDIEDLDKILDRWIIPSTARVRITQLSKEKKYSQACEAYFEETQSTCANCSIVNPIDFYSQSRESINTEAYRSSSESD